MGDFRLGCVLGMYDKAQSFDVDSYAGITNVNSWNVLGSTTSHYLINTDVHSSEQSVKCEVYSRDGSILILEYNYSPVDDLHLRWSPAVTTHDIRADYWARIDTVINSGNARIALRTQVDATNYFPFAVSLSYGQMQTVVRSSATGVFPRLQIRSDPSVDSYALYIDDVITQVDPIILHPGWGMKGGREQIRGQHRTAGGKLSMYRWAEFGEWEVPLTFLPTSHADLINWWWENQFILAWTLDTSGDTTHLVRIANGTQPIGSREPMDVERWRGSLKLESINDGRMVF